MKEKNQKAFVGVIAALGMVFMCGLGLDAYEKRQSRLESERERREHVELLRNWSEEELKDAPNSIEMKRVLDKAESALSKRDFDTFKGLYAEYTLLNIKALRGREPENVRNALHERFCEVIGEYVKLRTPNWDRLSKREQMDARIDLVCELDSDLGRVSTNRGAAKSWE